MPLAGMMATHEGSLDFGKRLEGSVGLQIHVIFKPTPGLRLQMDESSSPYKVPEYLRLPSHASSIRY